MYVVAFKVYCFFLQACWHLNRCKSLFVLNDIQMYPLFVDVQTKRFKNWKGKLAHRERETLYQQ